MPENKNPAGILWQGKVMKASPEFPDGAVIYQAAQSELSGKEFYMAVNIGAVQKLTSPNPFALVSTQKSDGTTNLMALSWWTYGSNNPATIAVCLSKKGYTGELIRENKDFCLNIVDESLKEAAFACGTCSGRTVNKPEKFGIELLDATTVSAKLVKAHRVAMECTLTDVVEVADHCMYIAEVVETHCDPEKKQLYALYGYAALNTI